MSVKAKVLSKDEMRSLLRIPTTVKQARVILRRNLALLRALNANQPYYGALGCPHCQEATALDEASEEFARRRELGKCAYCAWKLAVPVDYRRDFTCFNGSFGGAVKSSATCVVDDVYGESLMALHFSYSIMRSRVFLLGHIEWAREVIRRGGVPWPKNARCKDGVVKGCSHA